MKLIHTKKFRYGSVSLALTVVIIAAVILVNAIFTALSGKYMWYVDMTVDELYTLSDEAKALLEGMDTSREVTITFCTEKDEMEADGTMRFPLYTALEIADKFDNVKIEFIDIWSNPSAITEAQAHTTITINSQTIIVNSGTEYRAYTLESLFSFDSTGTNVIGYNGEQRFVSALLSVTRDEMPIACFTVNHGEEDNPNFRYISQVLYDAGYEPKAIDLSREEIPEDCRIVVVIDPQNDFSAEHDPFVSENSDELRKLEMFLDKQNSVMTFFDNATPYLPNYETFLASWGIGIARQDAAANEKRPALLIRDLEHSFDREGFTVVGEYVTASGHLGASLTKKLREVANPKSVLFPYSAVMYNTFVSVYNENGYWQANNNAENGISRETYDVFTSTTDAKAELAGDKMSPEQLAAMGLNVNADVPFSYMKLTRETQMQDNKEVYSHVLAFASTDFAAATQNSGYGNHTVLTYAASMLGREAISVSIDCKYFTDTEISGITRTEANQYTVVLSVVPTAVIFIAGIYVMIRRKYA